MESQSPPPTARRNPPRRAKAAVTPSAPSTRKRPQTSKLLLPTEDPPLKLEEHPPLPSSENPVSNPTEVPEENDTKQANRAESADEKGSNQSNQAECGEENDVKEPREENASVEERVKNNEDHQCPVIDNTNEVKSLQVFLRIRPAKLKEARRSAIGIPNGTRQKRKTQILHRGEEQHICLQANDAHSVTLTPPPSLLESKRAKTEIYNGFSHVFLPQSSQEDVYEKIMHPLLKDFVEGKSCLLVAMGPTSSGKTHTMFGNIKEPGLIPRTLKNLLSPDKEIEFKISRRYFISMFEIYSERGRGEKIIDLFQDGVELSLQQSNIKGLKEISIASMEEAECLLSQGMQKRTTAATNANSQSSRSQCIINIRSSPKMGDEERNENKLGEAVLTIVDLAGAEREKNTGNQGVRFSESNFINNTSMVFGLCLRALLEHQKNPKRSLQKHYHSSLLTRYLKDYLEAKGRMVMVLNVSPEEDNYINTAFVLRQASPYVNIKLNCPSEESTHLLRPKRVSSILPKGLLPKRRKFSHSINQEFGHSKERLNAQSLLSRTEKEEKVKSEDSIALVKDRSSCGSLSSESAPGKVEEKSINRDSSILVFTEEELKERISVEIECALNQKELESRERHMAIYREALAIVLKDHGVKVKMMEDHAQELEVNLIKEKEHCLKLSNEVQTLKERCACLEHENAKLRLRHNSGNLRTDAESECDKCNASFIMHVVDFQNDIKDEDLVRDDNSNTLLAMGHENGMIPDNSLACNSHNKEEDICLNLQEDEFRKGNLETVSPVDDKISIQNLERHSSSEVVVVHVDGMEALPGTISNCEEIKGLAILQASDNQTNYACNRDDLIGQSDVNTLMSSREECSLLVKEKQSCIRDEAEGIVQENVYNLLQINDDKHNDRSMSAIGNLENLSDCLVETGESVKSPNGNKIQACEDLVCFLDTESKCKGMDASIISQRCASSTGDASNNDVFISECNNDPILATREADDPEEKEQIAVKVQEKQFTECNEGSSIQTDAIIFGGNSSNILRLEDSSVDFIVNAEGGTLEMEKCIPPYEDQACFSGETDRLAESNKKEHIETLKTTKHADVLTVSTSNTEACNGFQQGGTTNLKKGRMLASLLVKDKVEDVVGAMNKIGAKGLEETKGISESYTTSEDDLGPIGECLEEVLDLSPFDIENGLWKGDIECKRKISNLLERHGGILDHHLFKKGYSQQRCLCLRYCFSLICNKISYDKQWVSLSEDVDPKSRQEIFWGIVKARSITKAASHARQGFELEGVFKNLNQSGLSQDGRSELQTSLNDSGNPYQATFPSKTLSPDLENKSEGKALCYLESNKENIPSPAKTPRRKLLPASSVFLKGYDDATVEDEIPKVSDRSLRKNSNVQKAVGTQGRMSLVRMLASKR